MKNPRLVPVPTKSGIYQIKNRLNGKSYVGSATKLNKRRCAHVCNLNGNKHHASHLQRSWNKHGIDNFEFIILEFAPREQLIEREQFYIDTLKPEYNDCPIAGTNEGRKLSPEHKEKLLASTRGRVVSQATREKIRQSLLGRKFPQTPEHREKIRLARIGKRHTEETKERIRQTKLQRYRDDPDLIQRLRTSHLGQVHSLESRKRQGEASRRYWTANPDKHPRGMLGRKGPLHPCYGKKWSEEILKKRSEGLKRAWAKKKHLAVSSFSSNVEAGTAEVQEP